MAKQPNRNELRIIGGKWRGRKIQFPDVDGLRPTSDRIRETLFNWLAPWVDGADCLDLFAGSGALGLEACSRGAAWGTLVDRDQVVIAALSSVKAALGADNLDVVQADGSHFASDRRYDIIFLDPPFQHANLNDLLESVEAGTFIKPQAWIYLETPANSAIVAPQNWHLYRHKQAGQVKYRLFQRKSH